MLRLLKNLFHRPAVRFGLSRDVHGRFRNPRFASFLSHSNRQHPTTDFQDAVLRGRKVFRQALVVLLLAGGAWIVLESARALSIF